MIGEILGNRYEILEKVGEGGMAIVYKARCNKLNRFVAVKILKKEFCDNEEVVSKFTREATAIATLSDPNIVNVLDVGKQDNYNYIVMEFIQGKTLKEAIKQSERLSYEDALSVGIQIAKALECAHRNNIIHRDVKPQNILVTNEGLVKVTDFGIAKSATSATIADTTTIMGSAHYFSPEQAKGMTVDARTDIYSLGVVLYEMVTGKLPFEAESPVSIALKHIQEEVVPPKQVNSKIPNSLSELIIKAMDKDPNRRYQSAKEIVTDLEKIKNDPNTIIDSKEVLADKDDGRTIIMAPVNSQVKPVAPIQNEIDPDNDDEYDDDYYDYDDEYDDEDDGKHKKNKGKKIIIAILAIIATIFLIFGISYFAFSNNGAATNSNTEVVIPVITGKTIDEAKTELESVGLVIVDRGEETSDKPEGTVIGVDPKEGTTVKKGSKVNVTTSSGAEKLTMKDFKNSELETLKTFLTKNGIKYNEPVEQFDDTVKKGLVIKTDPAAGTEITKDTNVTIYVSSGPKLVNKKVPSVIGDSENDARAKLSDFDVNVDYEEVDDASKVGKVTKQSSIGKSLEVGATVNITVGKAKAEQAVNVDSYINPTMTGNQAKAALEAAGFKSVTLNGNGGDKVESWSPQTTTKSTPIIITTKKADPITTGTKTTSNK